MPRLRDIREVAAVLGLGERDLTLTGPSRAKVHLEAAERDTAQRGRYVLVSAMTPTPHGEGKTVTAIGLAMGLSRRGRLAAVAVRRSSLGPNFGLKGGGAGGGKAQIEPLEECLLGLGSDSYAVESANNLLAAVIDDALMRAFERGGEGCLALAEAVEVASRSGTAFRPLYVPDDSPRKKLETLATEIYGAGNVSLSPEAERDLARYVSAGYGSLPICVAKTHLSLSHDAALKGAPSGYTFPVRAVRLAAGAGYLYALAGDIVTMPGAPSHARVAEIDLDDTGRVVGLA